MLFRSNQVPLVISSDKNAYRSDRHILKLTGRILRGYFSTVDGVGSWWYIVSRNPSLRTESCMCLGE